MTATALRHGYLRVDSQVRCECGRRAVRQVWFWQLTPGHDRRVQASLMLCAECYARLREYDRSVSDLPLAAD